MPYAAYPHTFTEVEQLTRDVPDLVQRDRIRALATAGLPPVRVVGVYSAKLLYCAIGLAGMIGG